MPRRFVWYVSLRDEGVKHPDGQRPRYLDLDQSRLLSLAPPRAFTALGRSSRKSADNQEPNTEHQFANPRAPFVIARRKTSHLLAPAAHHPLHLCEYRQKLGSAGSVMETFINATRPPHPFYPVEANIVGYLANEASVPQLLSTFGAGCMVVLGTTLALVRGHRPKLSTGEQAAILWNVLSRFAMRRAGEVMLC